MFAWFRFVAARDPQARFRFTPIQGAYGRGLAIRLGIDPENPKTNAVVIGGLAYLRSDAGLQILRRLPGWSWATVLLGVPRPIRDWFGLTIIQRTDMLGTDCSAAPTPAWFLIKS